MYINQISNQNFRALVPKSEYKGIILKLTESDSKKIAELIEKKTFLLFELDSIYKKLSKIKTSVDIDRYLDKCSTITFEIDNINKLVHEIKINRLNEQRRSM